MIYLYSCDVAKLNSDLYNKYYESLSGYRRNKADGYRFTKDKNLCVGAGVLLDYGLRRYNKKESEMQYVTGKNGKPYFENLPGVFFSVSHSQDRVAVSFSDIKTGCDIEKIADVDFAIAKRYFTEKEYSYILSRKSDEDKKNAFFSVWTAKESFIKLTGGGLSVPLNSFETVTENGLITGVKFENREYFIKEIDAFNGYKCCICSEKKEEICLIEVFLK